MDQHESFGETMIQIGDLVQRENSKWLWHKSRDSGVWLVIEEAGWKVLCVQGSKRRCFYMDSLEKL